MTLPLSHSPLILVTNDDGITAPGIKALVEAMAVLGEVVVVAPDRPQSGMGHAITIDQPIRLNRVHGLFGDIPAWQCSGTPVDCVKIARDKVMQRKPDLCVSGINHGSNSSINIIYSGTMSAAMEAAIEGIPSIGFSLLDFSYEADFSLSKEVAVKLSKLVLTMDKNENWLFNVNIPKLNPEDCKGIRLCRQAKAKWEEDFDRRTDPSGKDYYWMVGRFINKDEGEDTDIYALQNGYVSAVPVKFDLTHHEQKTSLMKSWNTEL